MAEKETTYAHSLEAKHIVEQNTKLHEENIKLREDLMEANNNSDTFEEEVDRREKQVTYQRGLLKNFVAIKEIHEKIKRLDDNLADNLNLQLGKTKISLDRLQLFVNINMIVLFCWFFVDKFYGISHATFLTSWMLLSGLHSMWIRRNNAIVSKSMKYYDKNNTKTKNSLREHQEELERIIKACDFLNEYVDIV